MTNENRKEMREIVLAEVSQNPTPVAFHQVIRAVQLKKHGVYEPEVMSIIYPMIKSGKLELTKDLLLSAKNSQA